jgi:hypothetical protein
MRSLTLKSDYGAALEDRVIAINSDVTDVSRSLQFLNDLVGQDVHPVYPSAHVPPFDLQFIDRDVSIIDRKPVGRHHHYCLGVVAALTAARVATGLARPTDNEDLSSSVRTNEPPGGTSLAAL